MRRRDAGYTVQVVLTNHHWTFNLCATQKNWHVMFRSSSRDTRLSTFREFQRVRSRSLTLPLTPNRSFGRIAIGRLRRPAKIESSGHYAVIAKVDRGVVRTMRPSIGYWGSLYPGVEA